MLNNDTRQIVYFAIAGLLIWYHQPDTCQHPIALAFCAYHMAFSPDSQAAQVVLAVKFSASQNTGMSAVFSMVDVCRASRMAGMMCLTMPSRLMKEGLRTFTWRLCMESDVPQSILRR